MKQLKNISVLLSLSLALLWQVLVFPPFIDSSLAIWYLEIVGVNIFNDRDESEFWLNLPYIGLFLFGWLGYVLMGLDKSKWYKILLRSNIILLIIQVVTLFLLYGLSGVANFG